MEQEKKLAMTHPGKMGDVIYTLPTIRWLCEKYNRKADFWTSSYCAPLKRLFEHQPYIDKLFVSPSYVVQNFCCGGQPWMVPVPNPQQYHEVFQLGFRTFPNNIPDYIANLVGGPAGLPIKYEYPDIPTLDEPYVVIAPRGEHRWAPLIGNLAKKCQIVQLGSAADKVTSQGIDKTGLDFLETTTWIAKSKAFIGCQSSQLVLAEGFNIPRFVGSALERDIIDILGLNCYNRCLDPADYHWMHEAVPHIDSIASKGFPHNMISHYHRRWEYGLGLRLIRYAGETVLDVGGAGSIFGVAATWLGKKVTSVDPVDNENLINAQNYKLGEFGLRPIKYYHMNFMDFPESFVFDNVICISTLEHVEEDVKFFKKLCKHVNPGGLLFLTVDFSHTDRKATTLHERTYNDEKIKSLMTEAEADGFKVYGAPPDYSSQDTFVFNYTFASICLQRKK
jgi:SAM-dependent methyltransferase